MNLMMDLSKFTSNKNILNEIVVKLCRMLYIAENGSVTAFFFFCWLVGSEAYCCSVI